MSLQARFFTLTHLLLLACQVLAAPSSAPPTKPSIFLDRGTFTGTTNGTVTRYLGIPFARPPVGDLRFRLPVANEPYTGKHSATSFGPACPQQAVQLSLPSDLPPAVGEFLASMSSPTSMDEDCLTLNVWVPTGTKSTVSLPVLVWIFGGGFQIGGTSAYDQTGVVQRSVEMKEPVIVVSMNYRLSALGFLASQEVKDAGVGNLGLYDQRLAFQWVQKYIHAFGGDRNKVTIWGESAGAWSVALHMVANGGNTEGLFHGAFMESGSPLSVGDITHGQKYYDALISQTGCSGSKDSLECLRQAPYDKLKAAMDASPSIFSLQSLDMAWMPRVDGVFLKEKSQDLVLKGSVANVPFVNGDCDDEGTLFSLPSLNITTDPDFRAYLTEFFFPNATNSEMDKLLQLYPANVTQGSPFDTGSDSAVTPEFKRIAAFLGDYFFQGPRRFFLQHRSERQNTWSFLSKRLKSLPVLGSAHASDLNSVFSGGDLADYLINFANHLNPNGPTQPSWPKYETSSAQLMTLLDGQPSKVISKDSYRTEEIAYVVELGLKYPL